MAGQGRGQGREGGKVIRKKGGGGNGTSAGGCYRASALGDHWEEARGLERSDSCGQGGRQSNLGKDPQLAGSLAFIPPRLTRRAPAKT